jgi:hypothetical protein
VSSSLGEALRLRVFPRYRVIVFPVLSLLLATAVVAQQADTVVRMAGPPQHAGVATLVEELSIGVVDGAEQYIFGSVFDIAVAGDGAVYVLDRSIPAIRKYDAAGRYVRTIARGGQGPGEIGGPAGMRVLRDGRLALYDSGNRRINVYTADGERLTEWLLPGSAASIGHREGFEADTAGNVYAKRTMISEVPGARPAPVSVWLRLRANDGAIVDTIREPSWPPYPEPFRATNERGWRQMGMPFTPRRLLVISPHGHAVSGLPERYAFELLMAGRPVVSVRRDLAPEPVSGSAREEQRTQIETRMREVDPLWTWGGRDLPRVKPFYVDLEVDADGRIWLTRERTDAPRAPAQANAGRSGGGVSSTIAPEDYVPAPTVYDVFAPAGAFIGTVEAPPGVTLFVMRGDRAWGVARDELDVEFVKRYRIAWR